MTVTLFWIAVASILVVGIVCTRRSRDSMAIRNVFSGLTVIAFQIVTVVHVRTFLLHSWDGDRDATVVLSFAQSFVNPIRIVLGQFPAGWLLGPSPVEPAVNDSTMHLTYLLWQVMIQDFVIGTAFWFLLTFAVFRLIARGGRDA